MHNFLPDRSPLLAGQNKRMKNFNHNKMKIKLREYSLKARSIFPSEKNRLDSGFALPAIGRKPCSLQPSYDLFHCTPLRLNFHFIMIKIFHSFVLSRQERAAVGQEVMHSPATFFSPSLSGCPNGVCTRTSKPRLTKVSPRCSPALLVICTHKPHLIHLPGS